jgi:hypothetical protein
MDFSDKELKILLQALYRFRGEVSGASQSEQSKFALVVSVIDKIESKVGPLTAERTRFDREMDESLAILKTGKMGLAKAAKSKGELDKAGDAAKVKKGAAKAKSSATEPPRTKKASGVSKKAGASKK